MEVKEKLKSQKRWLAAIGAVMPVIAQALTGQVGWLEALALSLTSAAVSMGILLKEDLAKLASSEVSKKKK